MHKISLVTILALAIFSSVLAQDTEAPEAPKATEVQQPELQKQTSESSSSTDRPTIGQNGPPTPSLGQIPFGSQLSGLQQQLHNGLQQIPGMDQALQPGGLFGRIRDTLMNIPQRGRQMLSQLMENVRNIIPGLGRNANMPSLPSLPNLPNVPGLDQVTDTLRQGGTRISETLRQGGTRISETLRQVVPGGVPTPGA